MDLQYIYIVYMHVDLYEPDTYMHTYIYNCTCTVQMLTDYVHVHEATINLNDS